MAKNLFLNRGKLLKMQFHEKLFLICLISRIFCQDHARQAEQSKPPTLESAGAMSNEFYDKNKSFFDSVSSSCNSIENPNGHEATKSAVASCYDKNKSFFDSISSSCNDATENDKGHPKEKNRESGNKKWKKYIGQKWNKETPGISFGYIPGYKTVMCEAFRRGSCHFGECCHFAHGLKELRPEGAMSNEELMDLEVRTRSNIEQRIVQLQYIQFEAESAYRHYLLNCHHFGQGRKSLEARIDCLGNILVKLDASLRL